MKQKAAKLEPSGSIKAEHKKTRPAPLLRQLEWSRNASRPQEGTQLTCVTTRWKYPKRQDIPSADSAE